MSSKRRGIFAAGNFIVDHVKIIDSFPEQDTLVHILSECHSNGGGPYNILKDLAAMQVGYPLHACGMVGDDADGRWIIRDCSAHGIDVGQLRISSCQPTSYTDAMTVRDSGRRTFFHQRGANDLFAVDEQEIRASKACIFYLGYLMLLAGLDTFDDSGRSGASRLLEAASSAGMITAVDLVSVDHSSYRELVLASLHYTDHLLLNELEASKVLDASLSADSPEQMMSAAMAILKLGVRCTVTIHSSRGAVCASSNGETATQAALRLPPDFIAGATGAGDAFAAGFLHGIHENLAIGRCLHIATCTAAASLGDPSPSAGLRPVDECVELAERFGFVPFGSENSVRQSLQGLISGSQRTA
ncbi:carbohydrate kinase family protein [Luteolibacter sp. LG18]|uniref:carbohydrate kinase family protein n=1 Tax=Luteolibacter sp. LG18 TaxID=2819286 RepID=UPI002B2D45DD|nr:sugar kinase [Luteolibacter sp. LG18]